MDEMTTNVVEMTDEDWVNLDRVHRLVRAATGEIWGDGVRVTDVGFGIVDYPADPQLWVMGNWNPKRFPRADEPALSRSENMGPRLADDLERFTNGQVSLLWSDEWTICDECRRAFRIVEDSYHWRKRGLVLESGSVLCEDDVDVDLIVDPDSNYVNNPDYALTFDLDLADAGFELFVDPGIGRYHNGDLGRYENGWHPGQDARPADVLDRARSLGWDEGIFVIPSVGQFDLQFELWVRRVDEGMDDDDE